VAGGVGGGLAGAGPVCVWRVWQWYPHVDFDVPAGDLDVFYDQPEQLLFLGWVEVVDDGADAGGEVLDAAAELVAFGKVGSLGGEVAAFGGEFFLAGVDGGGAAL
jgi:hypothetical protein